MACRWILSVVAAVVLAASAQPAVAPPERAEPSVPFVRDLPIVGRLFVVEQTPQPVVLRNTTFLKDIPFVGRLYTADQPSEAGRSPFPVLSKIPFVEKLFR